MKTLSPNSPGNRYRFYPPFQFRFIGTIAIPAIPGAGMLLLPACGCTGVSGTSSVSLHLNRYHFSPPFHFRFIGTIAIPAVPGAWISLLPACGCTGVSGTSPLS